jgi:hypothetical protein
MISCALTTCRSGSGTHSRFTQAIWQQLLWLMPSLHTCMRLIQWPAWPYAFERVLHWPTKYVTGTKRVVHILLCLPLQDVIRSTGAGHLLQSVGNKSYNAASSLFKLSMMPCHGVLTTDKCGKHLCSCCQCWHQLELSSV